MTLATMLIFRSLSQYICQHINKALIGGGSSVYRMASDISSYQSFYRLGNGKAATVPYVGIFLILITIVFVYLSTGPKFGKKIYAVGSNHKSALLSGINVSLMKISVFVAAGVLVGLGAFLWIAMNASCDPATTGKSYEMYVIAAVVLGGISMSGGKGQCLGDLLDTLKNAG